MTAERPRILIVRLSALGDVIHALPVLCALRAQLPLAHLAWLVEGRAGELLEGHPALDEQIGVRRGWLKSPRAVLELRRKLSGRFDITIDIQGLTKSALAARLSGAPWRIGFAAPAGRELSPWLNNTRIPATAVHVVERNLELLAPLGIRTATPRFDLPESSASTAAAQQILGMSVGRRPFALINPGAGWPSKLWPVERFAAVARHLGRVHHLPSLVVWAGNQERGWAEQIERAGAGYAYCAPPTSLTELAAVARQARLMLSSDTGPLHLAAAVGTPCIGLFGPMPAERNGPYGANNIAMQAVRPDPRRRGSKRIGNGAMLAIDAERVAATCDKLLGRSERQASLAG